MKSNQHSPSHTESPLNLAPSHSSESTGYDYYLFELFRSRQRLDDMMPHEDEKHEERRSIDWEGRHSSVNQLLKYVW